MRKTMIPATGVALLLMGVLAVGAAAPASAATMPMAAGVSAAAESAPRYEETSWLTAAPAGDDWNVIETRTVIDREAVPGQYEETGWVTGAPEDGRIWTQIAERYVVDVPAQPEQGEPTMWVDNPDYVPESTIEVFDHWQRYSWTGEPQTEDQAPVWPDPGWQPNVEGDPHGVGVEGAYYRSHGDSGNGDWFYLEAVNRTETVPAQGDPMIEVPNPDYRPAVPEQGHTEFRFAFAVDPVEELSHPEYRFGRYVATVPVPVDTPAEQVPVTAPDTLAETGADGQLTLLLGAGLLAALGAGLVAVRRFADAR
ncbi:LPXTG cell wall anchor domain-containing protein [Microbacterium immunditiarum]|uniref:LPXTG-motif cell wall-anchored protein n=1 Tax=Microbacterium immunditiarum TaxID=337480 RepID=A0A7Y9KKY8_9MICO|nr:LPXTG cell wall anchor domain-containing protein [Microbacterium immunditiarum]NYE19254.1 LPXTG-motif cell wall-anchored protein [Microbacterium immunditiarum]